MEVLAERRVCVFRRPGLSGNMLVRLLDGRCKVDSGVVQCELSCCSVSGQIPSLVPVFLPRMKSHGTDTVKCQFSVIWPSPHETVTIVRAACFPVSSVFPAVGLQ